MKRTKLRNSVKPFVGSLRKTVMRKTVVPNKLSADEIKDYVAKKGKQPPKTKNSHHWRNFFSVYTSIISLDSFLLTLQRRVNENKGGVKDVGLHKKYLDSFKYIKRQHKNDLDDGYTNNHRITNRMLKDLEVFLLALAMKKTPMEEKIKELRAYTRSPNFKTRLLGAYTRFMLQCFKLLKYNVSTKTRKNNRLKIEYTQFKFDSRTEDIVKRSSLDIVEEREARKRVLKIQEDNLKREIEKDGFEVETEPVYIDLGIDEEGKKRQEKQLLIVGYNSSVSNLPKKPTKNSFLASKSPLIEDDVARITTIKGKQVQYNYTAYKVAVAKWQEEKEGYVEEIYTPVLRNDSGDGYQKFESYQQLKDALELKRQEQFLTEKLTPTVKMPKDVKLEEGERAVAEIVFGEDDPLEYKLQNFASELDTEVAQETKAEYRQITDREGEEGSDISKIYPVKKIFIDGGEFDIISEGPFAGFKFDEMVNAMGRVVDNVYYDSSIPPKRVKLVDLSLDSVDLTEGSGFLELERTTKNKSGWKVARNRLVEPYVTVSSDGTSLMVGLPNKKMYKNDRDAMKGLKKAQLVKQVEFGSVLNEDGTGLSKGQQGANPFYTFNPENFSVVKSKLGSLSMSKPALDLIKEYERELEERNRALAPENVARFDANMLGGFKEEVFGKKFDFNDKQKEGMAWIESNGFKGVMSLDTGVGKTLFSGGAMQNFMNQEKERVEEEGEKSVLNKKGRTKKFLFVSPKKLVGNFSAEMYDFMKDESIIANRIEEMSYFQFARTVSSMNGIEEALKPGFKESTKKFRMKFLEGTDYLNKSKTKPQYEDADDYFRENYNIIFFDEVNEALKPMVKKSVSELEHPSKILLTASPMEKDPLDLYRFVSMSKGIKPDKKKEQEFLNDYANVIGGRFVGITDDVEKRAQFEKWVAENAFFALKEDVDLTKINMPRLLKPTYENVRIRMDDEVKSEYKKVASKFSKDLKSMVEKYRDLIKLKKSGKISEEELDRKMKGVVDYAVVGMKDLEQLQTLSTEPEKIIAGATNPKIEYATEIATKREGKKILYFSQNESVVKKNAKAISNQVPGLHVAMTSSDILFFKNGEEISKVTKNTDVSSLVEMNTNLRLASANPTVFFLQGGSVKEEDLNRVLAKILGGDILMKIIVDKRGNIISSYDSNESSQYQSVNWYDVPVILSEYEERKDPNQWAIGASKLIFKENNNLRTLSCTDLYARGFNFQFTTTVVHLDRGAGFDSEIIKQRTARSYRTKQDQRVEVLFLDATIAEQNEKEVEIEDGIKVKVNCNSAEDQTIDEIQDLVQGVDQDFFMSIINKAMKSKIQEDGTEKDLGESFRMNRQLLSQIIDPTGQNLSKMREELQKERENPLLTSAKNPERFLKTDVKERFYSEDGISEEKKELNLDLSGMSSFAYANFDKRNSRNQVTENSVSSSGRFLRQETSFEEDEDGFISIKNQKLSVTRCAPKGTGTRTIVAQITAGLAQKNVKEIVVQGDTSDKTHYIWPKLGFNAEVRLPFLVDSDLDKRDNTDEGRMEIKIRDWFVDNRRNIGENGEICLLDLYSCIDTSDELIGQMWWKENGFPVELKIDLRNPKNKSLRFFNKYFLRKCEEFEVETDQYLTLEAEPFDVDQPACWLDFLQDYNRILDAKGNPLKPSDVINNYFDAFLFAYVSRPEIRTRSEAFIYDLPENKLNKLMAATSVDDASQDVELDILSDPEEIRRYASQLTMKAVHERETKSLDSMWISRSKTINANVAYAELLEDQNLDVEALNILDKE